MTAFPKSILTILTLTKMTTTVDKQRGLSFFPLFLVV